jgi:hypothetical protein
MNDALRMQISAFVDGELPDNESELLLRRLSQDANLRQQVAQYLEIGRAMRGEKELPNMAQLRGRVAESLGEEIAVATQVDVVTGNRYVKPMLGFAVAASVALLAIFSLQQVGTQGDIDIPAPQIAEVDDSQVLDEMFRYHGSTVSGTTGSGILSQLVTLEIDEGDLVQVEPKAELIATTQIESPAEAPVEIENEIETDTDEDKRDAEESDAE